MIKDIRRSDSRINKWVLSWIDILCGLISVITLCSYRPWWDMSLRGWCAKSYSKSKVKEKQCK